MCTLESFSLGRKQNKVKAKKTTFLKKASSGPSGVGKTALTTSIIAGLSDRYIALHGKYNREHRGTPYSGFISCVDEFCHRILRDTEENVEKWKLKILNLFR